MVYLTRKCEFSASHYYHNPEFTPEENLRVFGKCANLEGHGHNYTLEVRLSGAIDPATGMVAHLADLDAFVNEHVISPFDHRSLQDEVAAFAQTVPTTENLCVEIFLRLRLYPKAKLEAVRIEETSNNSFEYAGNNQGMTP